MNSEESRIRTFAAWPENAVVDFRRIAKAGFYYMGQDLDVQCFSCGGRIGEWNYGDKVMARHKNLDPRCPFVVNPSRSGNIPLSSNPNQRNSSERRLPSATSLDATAGHASPTTATANPDDKYYDEGSRLESFSSWPKPEIISPSKLAKAGFFYTQENDLVRCAFCLGVLGDWKPEDDPDVEHQSNFPVCPFVRNRNNGVKMSGINVRESDAVIYNSETDAFRDLGVLSHRAPKNPWYSTHESRLKTFQKWPTTLKQKPEDLVDAGFFYTGSADEVRCFHCDGGLRYWQKDDVPWIEHARWFGECGFVSLIKGNDFIEESLMSFPPMLTTAETNLLSKQNSARRNHSVSEAQLQELMSSPAALAALQIGIEASRVKSALKQRMESIGVPFIEEDAGELIMSCLDIQSEEADFGDQQTESIEDEAWSTPPCSPTPKYRIVKPRDIVTPISSDEETQEDEEVSPMNTPNDVASSASGSPVKLEKSLSLEEENRRLKEARLCKICMDIEVGVVFLPCGHLVTCANCAHSLEDCPLCRQQIKATVRTFLS